MSRLRLIFGTVSYYNDVIKSCSLTQEISGISEELSVDYFDCTLYLDNAAIVTKHEKVQVWFGLTYLGTYYRTDFKQIDENLYSLKFQSVLGVIDKKKFAGAMYSAAPLADVVADITGTNPLDPWYVHIDDSYANITVTGYIPACTWREALQQVAFAVGACVSSSQTSGIEMFPPKTEGKAITRAEIFNTLDITEYQPVTAVKIASHSYTETEETSGEGVFEFDGKHYLHTVTYQTVTNEDAVDADENVITVEEATLVNDGNASAVLARLASHYFGRVTWKNKIVTGTFAVGDLVTVPAFSGTSVSGHIGRMQYRDIGYKLFSEIELDGHYTNVCTLTVVYTDDTGAVLETYARNYAAGSSYSIGLTAIEREADGKRYIYLPPYETLSGTINADKTETVVCITAAVQDGEMLSLYAVDDAAAENDTLVME